jgi:hypothetical protein
VGLLRSRGAISPSCHWREEISHDDREKKDGKGKALSILAHKIGRAVFYMLSRDTVFSLEKFMAA